MLDKLSTKANWINSSLERMPTLESNEIHIWLLPLEISEEQQMVAKKWLNYTQKSKHEKRLKSGMGSSYLAGRYYLYKLISGYSDLPDEEIELSYTRLNKPFLKANDTSLFFNFSDTSDQAGAIGMFAFSRAGEIGVDIESLQRTGNFSAIVGKRFTSFEQSLVIDQNGDVNEDIFLSVWTRKEASGKATGQGINFKMNQREVVGSINSYHHYQDESSRKWTLQQLRLSEELIGCVAYEGNHLRAVKTLTL
ncbi:MAG: 4'-phosphopantetheinyl transferase superfamily protein [Gammaproteobacteria bacterium]|nr:4'-phosphopantetheinyl transferase superfamily protein [Gammaproteobacteria bacterium]